MDQAIIDRILEKTSPSEYQGAYGHVLTIGGSAQYTNTPAIVALGALRGACDFVNVAAPEPSAHQCAGHTLNVMTTTLPGDHVQQKHVQTLVDRTDWADCTVIGPGLGRHDDTKEAVDDFLDVHSDPLVVDADALHVFAQDSGFAEPDWVLTPHPGEFRALTGELPPDDLDDRMDAVERYAANTGCTVLLKGATDVISDGDRTVTNDTGNPYMTRGGTGDVLAGLTAALISMRHDPFESACAATYFNGKAGDHALDTYGRGFLLEELLQSLSVVISPELDT